MTYQEEGQVRLKRLRTKQAIALAMEGKWREAVTANQEILESFPDDVDTYNRLGRAHMELGDYSEAKKAYQRALELDPYNSIAEKNIKRLAHLGGAKVSVAEAGKFEPRDFIEEIGKAGVINLHRLARPVVLARMAAGDLVQLKIDGVNLIVENAHGEYLGLLETRHSHRLIRLMEGGNRYTAHVISVAEDAMTIIIREVYQHPSQIGQLSFPTRIEDTRIYGGDRMIKRETEGEEEAEEPDYTIVNDEGEAVVEGFHEIDEKIDTE